ncbi:MAG: hypothetical protein D6762_05395 [Candidatus Neomarinimicrobiota bacterium]|nr:MAG: hypothetical protein D6762_05395 [Candidatus Neomarinimicrobiota bacterium]
MSPLALFWRNRLLMGRNSLRLYGWRRWVEISVSVVIVLGLTWGATRLFSLGFAFLHRQGQLGTILLNRVYALGWTVIFYLLIISNLATALSTLFRNRDVQFLWTTPLAALSLFRLKSIDNLIYSSWAVLILGIPLATSYGLVVHHSAWRIAQTLCFGLIPLLMIASALSQAGLLLLVRLSRWIRIRTGIFLLGGLFLLLFWVAQRYNQTQIIVAGEIPSTRVITRYLSNLGRTPNVWVPSYWFSQGIVGEHRVPFLVLLISTALVFWEGLGWLAQKLYYPAWQVYMMQGNRAPAWSRRSTQVRRRTPWQALLRKDVRLFIRSPQQWVQFLLFMVLITVYLVNLSRVHYTVRRYEGFWDQIVFLMNFGFSGFILASLITRFVFPLISLEGRTRWVLFSAPLTPRRIYRIKFWSSTLLFFAIAQWVAWWSNVFLALGWQIQVISTGYLLVMSIALTSISLGLGAVFPQFDETNPMRIVSGVGGIIAIVASLVYVACMVLSLIGFYNGYWVRNSTGLMAGSVGLALALSLACIGIFYRLGARSLEATIH